MYFSELDHSKKNCGLFSSIMHYNGTKIPTQWKSESGSDGQAGVGARDAYASKNSELVDKIQRHVFCLRAFL